jgi:hypothetical protein
VSKDLKQKMSRLQEDWADYIRQMIERRIKEHEMLEASRKIDEIRAKTKEGAYHAASSVREDRDGM